MYGFSRSSSYLRLLARTLTAADTSRAGSTVDKTQAKQPHAMTPLFTASKRSSAPTLHGRVHLWRRLGMSVGAGEQIAVTHFHQYNHAKVLSIRFPSEGPKPKVESMKDMKTGRMDETMVRPRDAAV